jgi:chaperonin cofactor prefoldin
MTTQFNIKNPEGLKAGDILIYDGKKFDVITKEKIVQDLQKQISELKTEIEVINNRTKIVLEKINERNRRFLSAFVREVK